MTDAERLEARRQGDKKIAHCNDIQALMRTEPGWGLSRVLLAEELEAEVERLRAIIAWAGNEEAVRIAGLPNPSPEEPSHAH